MLVDLIAVSAIAVSSTSCYSAVKQNQMVKMEWRAENEPMNQRNGQRMAKSLMHKIIDRKSMTIK